MRICITLDDVIRAKTAQIGKVYKKYLNPEIDLETLDITSDNLKDILGFDTEDAYNEFLYKDYAFEIFGEAPVVEKMLDKKLNLWHIRLDNIDIDEPIELILGNAREFNTSIGFTYFFLSQIGTRVREIYLPKDSYSIWDKCDVLVTANTSLINAVPEGKKVVRIETPYNSSVTREPDYSYASLSAFLDDENIIKKILNGDRNEDK